MGLSDHLPYFGFSIDQYPSFDNVSYLRPRTGWETGPTIAGGQHFVFRLGEVSALSRSPCRARKALLLAVLHGHSNFPYWRCALPRTPA